jgi:hypothetical protein
MALQGRGKLCRAQPDLKFIPPLVEDLLSFFAEPHGGDAFFVFTVSTEIFWVQAIELLGDLVGAVFRLCVGPAVDVAPTRRRIRPHEHLEALQQAVVALLSLGSLVNVGRKGTGLDAAQDGETQSRDVL